jgi:crotonobetainyl-CoA:carnitine CoA-transferase CaiB-like acyl-CoA transferase
MTQGPGDDSAHGDIPSQPLTGVRVLDVSAVLAAPVTATILGDFGADVVKVEQPRVGDFTRRGAASPGGRSLQWVQEGRNKRSITLDLHHEQGQDLLHRLVPEFDVVITNYRVPTLRKWRMDPDTLQRVHPDGVLAYITGYGLDGPYRDRGAFDRIASAFSGLTYVSGEPDRHPVRTGYAVIDFMTAYLASSAIMMALYHRDCHGGGGQVIDLALYESGFRASEDALVQYSSSGIVRERVGNHNRRIVPANDFTTKDGRRVAVHAGTETLFRRLLGVMDRTDLIADPRFSSDEARLAHQEELYPLIAEWAGTMGADELVDALSRADVPASALMSIADIVADPHYRERRTFLSVDDPEHGELLVMAPLPRMSGTPGSVRSLGPALGEHNAEVYGDLLGLTPEDLARLEEQGIV